jgi:dolichol-phosphate mannosyltransferase
MSASLSSGTAPACLLSLVIPTYNEAGNVGPLVERLDAALAGRSFEVLYVDDDSPDGTAAAVEALGRTKPYVRCLKRVGRRGLTSACLEGFAATSAPCIAVMDADLQHDEALLPRMLDLLQSGDVELVVGSRYAPGGSIGQFPLPRRFISHAGTWLARRLLGVPLSDPMSGFFMFRRDLLRRSELGKVSGGGFKILLDLVVSTRPTPVIRELPFTFRLRHSGESKFNAAIGMEFMRAVLKRRLEKRR